MAGGIRLGQTSSSTRAVLDRTVGLEHVTWLCGDKISVVLQTLGADDLTLMSVVLRSEVAIQIRVNPLVMVVLEVLK